MRATVCELPHDAQDLPTAWSALCAHCTAARTEWLVLPEFAWVPPLWTEPSFDARAWSDAVELSAHWLQRLSELGAQVVVGARPVTRNGQPFNEGFVWSTTSGAQPLRSKYWLPEEPGGWEARWFTRGDPDFPAFETAGMRWGLSICTEIWALENCESYARAGVQAIVTPRATAAATTLKWQAVAQAVAARTGAFNLSSNRVHNDGSCGGVGWIIGPDGEILARTSAQTPFCTVDIDLAHADAAKSTYPRYVFSKGRAQPA
jgi:N-carbamoylputrescine amidase